MLFEHHHWRLLDQFGWVVIPPWKEDGFEDLARGIGCQVVRSRERELIRPMTPEEASPSSLSASFGLSDFPLHCDAAHWPVPARYLAFKCLDPGREPTGTKLLDTHALTLSTAARSLARSEKTFSPKEFKCPVCALALNGYAEMKAANLDADHVTTEEREMVYEPDYGNC